MFKSGKSGSCKQAGRASSAASTTAQTPTLSTESGQQIAKRTITDFVVAPGIKDTIKKLREEYIDVHLAMSEIHEHFQCPDTSRAVSKLKTYFEGMDKRVRGGFVFGELLRQWQLAIMSSRGQLSHRNLPLAYVLDVVYDLEHGSPVRAANVYRAAASMAEYGKDSEEFQRFAELLHAQELALRNGGGTANVDRNREYVLACKDLGVAYACNGRLEQALDMLRRAKQARKSGLQQQSTSAGGQVQGHCRDEVEIQYHVYMVTSLMARNGTATEEKKEAEYKAATDMAKSIEDLKERDFRKAQLQFARAREWLAEVESSTIQRLLKNDYWIARVKDIHERFEKDAKMTARRLSMKREFHHRWVISCDYQLARMEVLELIGSCDPQVLGRLESQYNLNISNRAAYERDAARVAHLLEEFHKSRGFLGKGRQLFGSKNYVDPIKYDYLDSLDLYVRDAFEKET